MTAGPPDWAEVKDRLADVLALPEPQRAALLDSYAPPLRDAVADLLGAHDASGGVLDDTPLPSAPTLRSFIRRIAGDPLLGQTVGLWRIGARVSRDSRSTVYRAVREDGTDDSFIAIDVVRADRNQGAASGDGRQRPNIVAKRLAGLDHPGIVHVLDGGTLADGRSWFARDLAKGESIKTWAERQKPDPDTRVRLVIEALDALAHAHRHFLAHGALTPDHLIVDAGASGTARVRVLGLGIAALTDRADPGAAAYAPPASGARGLASTSADVYSLGVILFELLAGRFPARDASGDVRDSLASIAPTWRQRRILRGLDAVLAKALHAQPGNWYPTADAFADDLKRCLHRGSLLADSRPARRGRTARGLRFARLASGVILTALFSLGALHTVSLASERDDARRDAAQANAMSSFLTDLFRTYDPEAKVGDRTSARALLDSRVARLRHAPEAPTPDVLDAAARAYAGLALYGEAEPLAQEALALRRAAPVADASDRLQSLLLLADLRLWNEAYAGADSLTAEAVRLAEQQGDPVSIAEALRMRARYVAVTRGEARGDSLLHAALALQRRHLPSDAPELATTLHAYGSSLVYSLQAPEAIGPLREALRIRRAQLAPAHPDVAQTLTTLGVALLDSGGDGRETRRLLVEADRIFDVALNRAHPEAATALMNLGHMARDDGRLADAKAYYAQGLALRRQLLGPRHQTVAASLNNLGSIHSREGNFGEAYASYDEARRILEGSFPDGHVRTTVQLVQMGKIRREQGRYTESAALLRQAVAMRERLSDHRPRLIARAKLHLAATILPLGRHGESETLLADAARRVDLPGDTDRALLHRTYAQLYAETARPALSSRHALLAGVR